MKPRTLCVYTCELRLETREIGRNIKEANADVPPERKVRTKGLPTDTPEKCWRDDKVLSFSRLPEDTSRPAARPVQLKYLLLETVKAVHVNYGGSLSLLGLCCGTRCRNHVPRLAMGQQFFGGSGRARRKRDDKKNSYDDRR